MPDSGIRVILVKPSHPGNIGAVARAMKTMGLDTLYLVSPKRYPAEEAFSLAVHAKDILEKAVVVTELSEALSDITHVYATTANNRDVSLPVLDARTAALCMAKNCEKQHIAIVFGPENYGLSTQDLRYAHTLIQIPTAPDYHSLNLAAAVQIICYELHMAIRLLPVAHQNKSNSPFANAASLESFYGYLEEILIRLNFLDTQNPRKMMIRLRRLFNRAHLTHAELDILRGMLRAVEKNL